jgi:hypothetical protein
LRQWALTNIPAVAVDNGLIPPLKYVIVILPVDTIFDSIHSEQPWRSCVFDGGIGDRRSHEERSSECCERNEDECYSRDGGCEVGVRGGIRESTHGSGVADDSNRVESGLCLMGY